MPRQWRSLRLRLSNYGTFGRAEITFLLELHSREDTTAIHRNQISAPRNHADLVRPRALPFASALPGAGGLLVVAARNSEEWVQKSQRFGLYSACARGRPIFASQRANASSSAPAELTHAKLAIIATRVWRRMRKRVRAWCFAAMYTCTVRPGFSGIWQPSLQPSM